MTLHDSSATVLSHLEVINWSHREHDTRREDPKQRMCGVPCRFSRNPLVICRSTMIRRSELHFLLAKKMMESSPLRTFPSLRVFVAGLIPRRLSRCRSRDVAQSGPKRTRRYPSWSECLWKRFW